MELRSMSKRPPPPYSEVVKHELINLHNESTSRQQNGSTHAKLEKNEDTSTIIFRSGCTKFSKCQYIIYCVSGLSMFLLCALLINLSFPYPMHASCIVKWKFGDPCTYTMEKFRCQILNWSSCINCGSRGSKCLYTLKEPKRDESNIIRAIHLASNMKTMETIKITFEEVNKTCTATGESVSNEWFRIFDYGTNYCNLHNLVTAIGFDKNPRFVELTTNTVCTQYNMAVCD
ncbi:uncharacterized protein LOC143181128 [Calliopsis andreniformis]|uniref:uncharacterized protein LOC143181128 n=1 Tax=Calliopsis andreniformis TaxID=337506 RepID=UPI003FCDDCA8